MVDYFQGTPHEAATLVQPSIAMPLQPDDPPGTATNPLGAHHAPHAQSYLLGIRCSCGRTCLVLAAAYESDEDLACPNCAASLK